MVAIDDRRDDANDDCNAGRPILFSLCEWGESDVVDWGSQVAQMYRVQVLLMTIIVVVKLFNNVSQQDHLPFWHFPPLSLGTGYGGGTVDIIEYMAYLKPSQYNRPYGWMVCPLRVHACICHSHFPKDPDFLETLFYPTMNFVDSRTEYTFWSLWSAPLIIATDLRNLGLLNAC